MRDGSDRGARGHGWARRLYRALLYAYPGSERRAVAADMEELFQDLLREARSRGRLVGTWLIARAGAEAVTRGLGSRWRRARRRLDVTGLLGALAFDARHAARGIRSTPLLSATAVLVFALAIGGNATVFSVVEAALLRPLPYDAADRLVDVNRVPTDNLEAGTAFAGGGTVSLRVAEALASRARSLESTALYTAAGTPTVITDSGPATLIAAWAVSSDLFPMLGVAPALGRGFSDSDDRPGAERVVILSHEVWGSRFGADPEIVGQDVRLNGEPWRVVGVMPTGFRFPVLPPSRYERKETYWVPLGTSIELLQRPGGQGGAWLLGRLEEGIGPNEARAELAGIVETIPEETWTANVTPIRDWVVGDTRQPLLLLAGAVLLVLLVACANVATLLLARASARRREIALRLAIGAGRGRILAQSLLESTLLATIGAAVGFGIALRAVPAVAAWGRNFVPLARDVSVNGSVLTATVAMTVIAGILAGCAPAVRSIRRARSGHVLAGASTGSSVAGGSRVTAGLVVAQVAVALVLLAGAGLLIRSVSSLRGADPGFEAGPTRVAELQLPSWSYQDGSSRLQFARELHRRVEAMPGVGAVAIGTAAPFQGMVISSVSTAGSEPDQELPWAFVTGTTESYFEITDLPLRQGRLFEGGLEPAEAVAVINEAAAKAYFPDGDALGSQIFTYRWRETPLTVIGVVGDSAVQSLRQAPHPQIFVPFGAGPERYLRVLAESGTATPPSAEELRAVLRQLDPTVPLERVTTVQALVRESFERESFHATLIGIFAVIALTMTVLGTFAVMQNAVARRTRELGIRMALGARNGHLLGLVARRALALTGVGIFLGLAGATITTGLLESLLYELSPYDPWTYAGAIVGLLALNLLACTLPALRALRVDPAGTLDSD